MKILVLQKEGNDCRYLNTIINSKPFNLECHKIKDSDEAMKIISNLDNPQIRVVIIDRIFFKLAKLKNIKNRFDWFFIVNNISDAKKFGKVDFDMKYRFYIWPLNVNLLMDDIKSLSFLREYMTFGEISLGDIHINLGNRTVSDGKHAIFLKNKEYELLLYLAKNRGKVLSRSNILENVWDMNTQVLTNTVDVHISKLRRKLKENFGLCAMVKTIPCSGYILL